MFDLEPGPLEPLPIDALRPFAAAPSFEGLVAAALNTAGTVDAALEGRKLLVAGEGVPDLDGAYTTSVGVSEATLATQQGAEDDGRAAQLGDTTDGAEAYRQTALPHLPQPDAPIVGEFTIPDPPVPEGGGPGAGNEGGESRE